jgi:HAMP domain-containing protein
MTLIQKIRTSFTTKLSIWVAGFVLVTSSMVIILIDRFSEDTIRAESIDTTMQTLENTALRIDNALRQAEMTARLEKQSLRINRSRIELLIEENSYQDKIRQALPNAQLYVTRRDSSQFDTYITGNLSGYRQLTYEDKDVYVFSQPIGTRNYCLAAVCPSDDIYGKYARMHWVLLSWAAPVIFFLLIVLYYVIAHHLHPLHSLADSAQAIAEGKLETPIGNTAHQYETGRLQNSLSQMQRKLTAYIYEMRQKQNMLNRQHAELQAAYDEAQAYEKKKAKFLNEMTDRMATPVEHLCHSTNAICQDYSNLSKKDMTALQTDIMQSSETIIELLDQLIKDPANS